MSIHPKILTRFTVHRTATRRGVVATECALTLPVLLLIGLASADFGRVAHFYETVASAARTAAEAGASQGFTDFTESDWQSRVRQAAVDELSSLPDFQENQATITVDTSTDSDGMTLVAVTVSYPFRPSVAWPGLSSELLLKHRLEFRQFR